MKWVRVPADAREFFGIWPKRRKLNGAKAEDLVFPAPPSPNSKRRSEWAGYRQGAHRRLLPLGPMQPNRVPSFKQAARRAFGLNALGLVEVLSLGRAAIRSGRLMLQLIAEHVAKGESFAFETTLAGRNYARSIPRWRAEGYRVTLYFLSLLMVDIAVSRVAERVRQGGHDVPEDVIRRRFISGRDTLETLYKPIVDKWLIFDNSGSEPLLLDSGANQ